jgi:hypothetical protein
MLASGGMRESPFRVPRKLSSTSQLQPNVQKERTLPNPNSPIRSAYIGYLQYDVVPEHDRR